MIPGVEMTYHSPGIIRGKKEHYDESNKIISIEFKGQKK